MKLNLLQPYLCLLLLLMVSCRKETAVSSFTDVTECVSLKSLIGNEATISFTSTGSWTVTTDAVWLNLSPLSGSAGEGVVKATVISENNSKEERKAKIELKSGTEVCEITVFQEAGDYVLPEHTEYVVGVEGGEVRIQYESNVSSEELKIYTSSESGTWMEQRELTRAEEKTGVFLHVFPNKGGMSRVAYLLFVRETEGQQKKLATVKISQMGGQVLESVDFSEDGKVDTLQWHSVGQGIPVILMGDGFVDQEIADGTYSTVMKKAMSNLFSEEPLKSLRNYFDVFMIRAVSENNDFGAGYHTAFSCKLVGGNTSLITGDDVSVQVYVKKVLKDEAKRRNCLTVVILNTEVYAGTTYLGYKNEKDEFIEFAIAYCPVIEGLESGLFRQVLVHEAVGHGFGKLEDEYVYMEKWNVSTLEMQKVKAMQKNGWSQNVDFTDVEDSVLWAPFLKDSRYQSEKLGIYEGACTYAKGIYRPSEDSMMNSNTCGFNAPSRKSIYEKVMKLGLSVENVSYEDFVAFDKAHLPEVSSAKYVRVETVRPLARPVWVR
jgi:hypothetical protein